MTPPISADHLAAELERLEVPFLAPQGRLMSPIAPDDLLAGLAACDDARVRLALIPLLITYPEYAVHAKSADNLLKGKSQTFLRCYYTAAMLLQKKYGDPVLEKASNGVHLPDLFSTELVLSNHGSIDDRLMALANRHSELSGSAVDWLGTYGHGVRFLHLDSDSIPK